MSIRDLEPKLVWEIFDEITKHPRPSKKEEKIVKYIEDFAANLNLPVKKDKLGNMVITKPATPGMEGKKKVCIQAHVDMVTEKNRDVEFDFENDAIQTYIDGDWVKAKGTTLGADNGMGLAMGMAVLASDKVNHPEYELLCTLDEETGLTGAAQLGTDLLDSDILINLDTEEDGHFTIGCAGGVNTNASMSYVSDTVPDDHKYYELGIKGLIGGHSGIEIHDGRANANKLLSRLLLILHKDYNIRLSTIDGGDKHNAIPRESFSKIAVPKSLDADFNSFLKEFESTLKNEWGTKEPNLEISLNSIDKPSKVLSHGVQEEMLLAFAAMPHGVIRMSPDIEDLVQTSTNFAKVATSEDSIDIVTSQRSSVDSEKGMISQMVESVLDLGGFDVEVSDGYPAWQPNLNSPIIKTAEKLYEKAYNKKPVIEVIHAGLECGLIGEKYPNMDMISFGPTLKDVHTPSEKIQISTVATCWEFLVKLLEEIPE